jgi:erythromycin esterase
MIARRRRSEPTVASTLESTVRTFSTPLRRTSDLGPLMDRIGDARLVLLGEASHGTSDYYRWRMEISRRLIEERGFNIIAVEGDWPDCYRVNRFVRGWDTPTQTAREVLHAFERWPTWMWANREVVELAEWLYEHNQHQPKDDQVGFYGLDVYSLWESLYAILDYLQQADPAALTAARDAFQCFDRYGEDAQVYARATRFVPESCENEVVELLRVMRERAAAGDGESDDSRFVAEQNALVMKNAEAYYRAMVRGGPESWNIRDQHMTETLERLLQHRGPESKAIVWEHNTHIGDARFTDMADLGEVNVGQLVRERHAAEGVVLAGFGSYEGTVIAGRYWDAPMERMTVPPAREGSWEDVLHRMRAGNQLLIFPEHNGPELLDPRGHRAIGVVYHPDTEHYGNYVPTVLPHRYDAFLYLDRTEALHPLHEVPVRDEGEVPETYPSGV